MHCLRCCKRITRRANTENSITSRNEKMKNGQVIFNGTKQKHTKKAETFLVC